MVDLAGSERIAKTFNKDVINPEQRLLEAKYINLSLTSLGQVFTNLNANSSHVPYVHPAVCACLATGPFVSSCFAAENLTTSRIPNVLTAFFATDVCSVPGVLPQVPQQ